MLTTTDLVPHPIRPTLYVTENGRLFVELSASPSDGGYHTVKVGKETIRRHTLVAETFLGIRPFPKAEIRHLDGDPGNDLPSNLLWGTKIENSNDTVLHGRTTRGERNARARLTEAQAVEIIRRRLSGESGRSLAEEFDISPQTVCGLAKGRSWRHLAEKYGLPWGETVSA